jgi:hypothetical protein
MGSKIYVGGLPYSTTEEELSSLFAAHGAVQSAKIITDKFTGKSRGFGFVEMATAEEADGRPDPDGERGAAAGTPIRWRGPWRLRRRRGRPAGPLVTSRFFLTGLSSRMAAPFCFCMRSSHAVR